VDKGVSFLPRFTTIHACKLCLCTTLETEAFRAFHEFL